MFDSFSEYACVTDCKIHLSRSLLTRKRMGNSSITHLKGKYHGVLTSFVKNGEIRPLLCYKIILEQREERNQLNS